MKIGVLSDTHIPVLSAGLPPGMIEKLKNCDLIVHAGDIVEGQLLEQLREMAEVKAVQGNMDSYQLKRILPERLVFEVEGVKVGVVHGSGAPSRIRQRVLQSFSPKPDVIIFGHSHKAVIEKAEGVLLFNPGAASTGVFSNRCTYGIIEIAAGKIVPEIIECP